MFLFKPNDLPLVLMFLKHQTCALFLVPMIFALKSVLSRLLLCFSQQSHLCFPLVPVCFTVKFVRSRWFLCFSHSSECFVVRSCAFYNEASVFCAVPMAFLLKNNAFPFVPIIFTV